jgi:hypothetical protein
MLDWSCKHKKRGMAGVCMWKGKAEVVELKDTEQM